MAEALLRQTSRLFTKVFLNESILGYGGFQGSVMGRQTTPLVSQVCSIYDWRIQKDMKRRRLAGEYATLRTRINSLRKNTILPRELQEVADQEIAALPRDSCYVRIRNRCVLTARPRGVLKRWRISRILWRHLADYNKLSGITRSTW